MADYTHDPVTGKPLPPKQFPIDPNDPRMGVPPDKHGAWSIPFKTPDRRQAVMMMLFPPEFLRDATYEVVEAAVFLHANTYLRTIAREIHQSYTSEPLEAAPVQNLIKAFQGHLDGMRKGSKKGPNG
jgi:hypothetical protein